MNGLVQNGVWRHFGGFQKGGNANVTAGPHGQRLGSVTHLEQRLGGCTATGLQVQHGWPVQVGLETRWTP